jgi:flagellar basal-body rod modification protein FlgD
MITADFQTFLLMLTTQMQNQDPLNPMDSTEFASQLAQFSGVEQQVRTNDLLVGMQAGLATLGMAELGGWIGMEARAEMSVNFDGQAVTLAGTPNARADRMELIVRDARGQVVQQIPVPLSDNRFDWNGRDLSGVAVPSGVYSLSIQNWSGEDMIEERPAMVYSTVDEAQMIGNEVWLTMQGGQAIPASSVLGLGRPA